MNLLVHFTLLGVVPVRDVWCPDCLKSSMMRFVFALESRGTPTGVNQSAPVCQDCGRVGV